MRSPPRCLSYGIVTSPSALAGVATNHAVVEVGRYLGHHAGLPQLEQGAGSRFHQLVPEQLRLRQSDEPWPDGRQPGRSRRGQPLSPALGPTGSAAVDRYLNDKVKPPRATSSASGGAIRRAAAAAAAQAAEDLRTIQGVK